RAPRGPAGVAHPVVVPLGVVARLEAEQPALAVVDLDVAAVRARAAHRVRALEVPDARLEPEVLAGERADGTDVDHVHRVGVVERLPGRELDARVVAALEDAELARLRDLVAEAGAARAEDAALLVEHDVLPDLDGLAL